MTERVFTSETGDVEIEFDWTGFHCAHYVPAVRNCWRERPDGSREAVIYHIEHGWQPITSIDVK